MIIDRKTQKATKHLRANRKEVALTHLKMRKQLEDLLRKRLGSLEVLQSTLMQVEGAAQDIEVCTFYTHYRHPKIAYTRFRPLDHETIRIIHRNPPNAPRRPLTPARARRANNGSDGRR